ncbi:MAG: hypothetical protein FWE33_03745 [Defluviitaleaceae bacterium]|nr:hypothetical protein [Defluviitaleaceae bacterium]
MKLRTKAIAGAAVVLTALAATGCGSHLANNAAGLRTNDGVARHGVTHNTGRIVRSGYNRGFTRTARRATHPIGDRMPTTTSRRGIDRTTTQNHYLRQENLALQNGRHIGNEVTRANDAAINGTIANNEGSTANRLANNIRSTVLENRQNNEITPYASRDGVLYGNDLHTADGMRTAEPHNNNLRDVRNNARVRNVRNARNIRNAGDVNNVNNATVEFAR